MHQLLKNQLMELRQDANARRVSREFIMKALTETQVVNTNNYRHRLDAINEEVESDLRYVMQETRLKTYSPEDWKGTSFKHPKDHNRLVGILKKEDYYFEFEDPEVIFDSTVFSLSELPLESKLLIIDLLQK